MSYNGTGTFNINTAGQPVVTGTTITSTAFNALTADLANGLTTALTKDGQTTPTANIPMGTFKITGLGAGTAATDAAQFGQLQAGATQIATVTGTDTFVGTLSPALSAYATGNLFSFVAPNTNTGASTINLNSLGAKSITKLGSTALAAGDIVSGRIYLIEYDGTRFQLINPSASSVASFSAGTTGFTPSTATTGAVTLAGTLATTNGGTGLTSFTSGGVVYASSTSALTTGSALTFDGTNLGVSVTLSSWSLANYKALQVGNSSIFSSSTSGDSNFVSNAYYNAGWKYIVTAAASYYSQNGGINYWYNAPSGTAGAAITFTEAMRLDASGNLGIGTSSPAYKLDVNGAAKANYFLGPNDITYFTNLAANNGVIIRGGSGSPTNQVELWTGGGAKVYLDTAGNLGLGVTPSAWGSNWKAQQIGGFTSLANSSANGYTMLANNAYASANNTWNYSSTNPASMYLQSLDGTHKFYNAPSGTAGNAITFTQAMTLDASGSLLVGETTAADLAKGFSVNPGSGSCYATIGHASGTATGYSYLIFGYNGSNIGSITQSGTTAVLYNLTSDQRLKENIKDADDSASLIDAIQVRQYDWKSDGSHQRYGFVAQELVTVAPEAVHQPTDPDEMMAVDYSKLVPMLVKEIQSLRKRLTALEGKT